MYLLLFNKKPRFNNNPPFLSELFQILKTCLIITPPLVQKILLIILIFFHVVFGTKSDDNHFLKTIRYYNPRCLSQAEDRALLFFVIFF